MCKLTGIEIISHRGWEESKYHTEAQRARRSIIFDFTGGTKKYHAEAQRARSSIIFDFGEGGGIISHRGTESAEDYYFGIRAKDEKYRAEVQRGR